MLPSPNFEEALSANADVSGVWTDPSSIGWAGERLSFGVFGG